MVNAVRSVRKRIQRRRDEINWREMVVYMIGVFLTNYSTLTYANLEAGEANAFTSSIPFAIVSTLLAFGAAFKTFGKEYV